MKFKKPIEVQAGISDGDPTNPLGISGYLLSSDGSNVNWVSPGGLSAETAEAIVQPIKANEALTKGDPLYIVGYQTGQDVNIVAKADSSDVAKMPVVGLADDDYANQAFGTMTAFGSFNGDFDTTGGTESWAVGDIIFVKPGGGLTNIKPGGTDLIQNVAIVSRRNQNTGELEVIALGRTNDVPNLPTGRLFVGTAANTSLASDVIYVDDTNDRVGIGTTSPDYKLEVDGTLGVSRTDGIIFAGSAALGQGNKITSDTSNNLIFSTSLTGAPYTTTEKVRILNNGNVGIGATSPTALLTLESSGFNPYPGIDIKSTSFYPGSEIRFLNSSGGEVSTIESYNNPGISYLRLNYNVGSLSSTLTLDGGFLHLSTAGSEKMRITSAGNVGIGTTNPTRKLHVLGPGNSTPNDAGGIFLQTSSGGGLDIYATSTAANPVFNFRTFGGEEISFSPNSTELMRLKGSNVGIGTTNPAKKLTIGGIGIGNTDGLKIEDPSNTAYGAHFSFDDGSTTVEMGGVTNNTLNDCISIARDATRTITIDTSERVGIGTTTPKTKLHVLGTTSSMPSLGAAASAAQIGGLSYGTLFSTLTSGRGVIQQGRSDGTPTPYDLLLQPVGGRVGIARTGANYTLDVNGTGRFTDTLYYSSLVQQSQADTKKDIANIDKNKATAIPFKQYKYKTGDTERVRYGVVVEDIEQYYPELVHTGEDGVKGVSYIDLLVKRVAELEKELEDISLTPGPKGDTGATGATGPAGADGSNGKNGADGNSHLSNITSIAFNPKANRLQVNIGGTVYNFAPSK